MKIANSIEINRPAETVVGLLENHDNYFKWDNTLESYETFIGDPGEVGAKTRYFFKLGKKKNDIIEAIETVTYRDFPKEYNATYETMGFKIMQRNFFERKSQNITQWIIEQECELNGMNRLFSWLFRLAFKKRIQKSMIQFKKFAEKTE